MRQGVRMLAWIGLTVAATYVIAEWSVLQKSGLHDLRTAEPVAEVLPVPVEPERLALQAQVEELARTFAEFRAAKEREIADRDRLIAHLTKQIQALVAHRAPVEQVAALRAASRPVRWARVEQDGADRGGPNALRDQQPSDAAPSSLLQLAREVGFTKAEVRR